MKKIFLFIFILLLVAGCTENSKARNWGGKQEITLKPNEILLNITWKETDMWVLTKDTLTKVQYFRESSSFGIFEGEITIK